LGISEYGCLPVGRNCGIKKSKMIELEKEKMVYGSFPK
jgi:hypothetical protein